MISMLVQLILIVKDAPGVNCNWKMLIYALVYKTKIEVWLCIESVTYIK